jgi:SAM-dependent methyltransferase
VAAPPGYGHVIPRRLNQALGTIAVETLLAHSQSRFFTALGDLDWYSRSHRHWIDELVLHAGDRVLEVGCATGSLTAYIEASGCRVTGLDRSEDLIRLARTAHPQMDFRVGNAMSLSFDENAFDAVVAASVINVVPDAESVVSEMRRVCAPGGTVSILVPSSEFTDADHDALVERLGLTGFSRAALTKWHQAAPKMSGSQLETLLRGVGLERVVTRSHLDGMLIAASATSDS